MAEALLGEEFRDDSKARVSAAPLPFPVSTTYRHTSPMHSGYTLDVSEIINKFRAPLAGPNWNQASTPPTPVSEVAQPQPSAANAVDDYSALHRTTTIPSAKRTRAAFSHVDHYTPPFAFGEDTGASNSVSTTAAFELPEAIYPSRSIFSSDSSTSTPSSDNDAGLFSKGAPNPYSDSSSPDVPSDSSPPTVGKSLGTYIYSLNFHRHPPRAFTACSRRLSFSLVSLKSNDTPPLSLDSPPVLQLAPTLPTKC